MLTVRPASQPGQAAPAALIAIASYTCSKKQGQGEVGPFAQHALTVGVAAPAAPAVPVAAAAVPVAAAAAAAAAAA